MDWTQSITIIFSTITSIIVATVCIISKFSNLEKDVAILTTVLQMKGIMPGSIKLSKKNKD